MQRNLLAHKTIRIASAIIFLMMMSRHFIGNLTKLCIIQILECMQNNLSAIKTKKIRCTCSLPVV